MTTRKETGRKAPAKKAPTRKAPTRKKTAKKTAKKTGKKTTRRPAVASVRSVDELARSFRLIEVDENSVRHWLGHVETGKPDHPDLTNKMLKQLGADVVEGYFRPLVFLGWRRRIGGEMAASRQKKHWSPSYLFGIPDDTQSSPLVERWILRDLKSYLAPRGEFERSAHLGELIGARQAGGIAGDEDLARARQVLAGQAVNCEELDLGRRKLRILPPEIGRFTRLRSLDLQDNKLRRLPAEIGALTHLERLDLEGNELEQLPAELGNLQRLMSLNLDWNERLVGLPAEIGRLRQLRYLSASNCHNLERVPEEIGDCTELRHLGLVYTEIAALPAGIGRLQQLEELWVISGVEPFSLPAELVELRALHHCILVVNVQDLPGGLERLTALTRLKLEGEVLEQQRQRLERELPGCTLEAF